MIYGDSIVYMDCDDSDVECYGEDPKPIMLSALAEFINSALQPPVGSPPSLPPPGGKLIEVNELTKTIVSKKRQHDDCERAVKRFKDDVDQEQQYLADMEQLKTDSPLMHFLSMFTESVTDNILNFLDTKSKKALSLASRKCFDFTNKSLSKTCKLKIPKIKESLNIYGHSEEWLVCEKPDSELCRPHDTVSIEGDFYAFCHIPQSVKSLSLKNVTRLLKFDLSGYTRLEHLELTNSYITMKEPNRTVKSVAFRCLDQNSGCRSIHLPIHQLKFENLERVSFEKLSPKLQYFIDDHLITEFIKNHPTIKSFEMNCHYDMPTSVFEAIRDYTQLEEFRWINGSRDTISSLLPIINELKYLHVFHAPLHFNLEAGEINLNSIESLYLPSTDLDEITPRLKASSVLKTLKVGCSYRPCFFESIAFLFPNLESLEFEVAGIRDPFNRRRVSMSKLENLRFHTRHCTHSITGIYAPELKCLDFCTSVQLQSSDIAHIVGQFPKLQKLHLESTENHKNIVSISEAIIKLSYVRQLRCAFILKKSKVRQLRKFLKAHGAAYKIDYRQLEKGERVGAASHIIDLYSNDSMTTFVGKRC